MLLRVADLCTGFQAAGRFLPVVEGVSFELDRGRTLALVGESGCGKSLTALSLLRLVAPPGRIAGGAAEFEGTELFALPEPRMRAVRGNRIAMIFQEPMTALNPLLSVGEQIVEPLRVHRGCTARKARTRGVELLERVGIAAAADRFDDFPHQLSGGMRQRVCIAMALTCEPALLIADEPTTALDVTIQGQILELLRELQRETGMAMLFITHDLGVVAHIANEVCVMYAGRIVERAPAAALFSRPLHPYTQGLLKCTPRLRVAAEDASAIAVATSAGARMARPRLAVIPGEVPDPQRRPSGCSFHPRCELGRGDDQCRRNTPALVAGAPNRAAACWKVGSFDR